MTKALLVFAAFLTVLMVGAVLLYQYFGAWGLVGAVAISTVTLAFLPRIFMWIIARGLRKAMSAHAKALHGATVEVHSVESAPEVPREEYDEEHGYDDDGGGYLEHDQEDLEEEEEEEVDSDKGGPFDPDVDDLFYDGPQNWYYVDMTVYPAMRTDGRATEYLPWQPGMISFHGPSRPPLKGFGTTMLPFPDMADCVCDVHEVIPWGGESTEFDESGEVFGPRRLRLHIGVQPKLKKLRIFYIGELIGELSIPQN